MKVLLFGDPHGIKTLLPFMPDGAVAGFVGAGNRPHYHRELAAMAAEAKVPFQIQAPQTDSAYRNFEKFAVALQPTFLFCYSYSMRIPTAVFTSANTAINIHGGPLPEYRGCSPIQWSIITGDNRAGATIHRITEKFDQGDIFAQERVNITPEETWLDVWEKVNQATLRLLHMSMGALLTGQLKAIPQNESVARHWPRRNPADGQINFNWSSRKIYNHIRALVHPMPGVFYYDSSGHKIVLDSFLPLPEVVRLKAGIIPFIIDGVALKPSPRKTDGQTSPFKLDFVEGGVITSRIELSQFTYPKGQTKAFLSSSKVFPERLVRILEIFCAEELETQLSEVIVT